MPESPRYAIDKDQDEEGLRIIADFHNGDLDDPVTRAEWMNIKLSILEDRKVGDRSYAALWRRYKGRVLIAMSSQGLAQLVSRERCGGMARCLMLVARCRTVSTSSATTPH